MKIFFIVFLFTTFSSYALTPSKTMKDKLESTPQTQVLPKAAPGASTPARNNTEPEVQTPSPAQQQEQSPGVENDFAIGDYDKDGNYVFFDRLEREKKEADDEAAEQNQ